MPRPLEDARKNHRSRESRCSGHSLPQLDFLTSALPRRLESTGNWRGRHAGKTAHRGDDKTVEFGENGVK